MLFRSSVGEQSEGAPEIRVGRDADADRTESGEAEVLFRAFFTSVSSGHSARKPDMVLTSLPWAVVALWIAQGCVHRQVHATNTVRVCTVSFARVQRVRLNSLYLRYSESSQV